MSKFQTDANKALEQEQIAENDAAFQTWVAKHEELHPGDATRNVFDLYMDFSSLPHDEQAFEFAYKQLKKEGKLQYVTRRLPTREELIEELCTLLRNPDGSTRGGKYSDEDLRSFRLRLPTWSTERIKAEVESVKLRQAHAAKPVSQLKAEVAQAHRQERPMFAGYPRLLDKIVPKGEIQQVDTGEFLRAISKSDYWLWKRYVLLYSASQVDFFMQDKHKA
jgi:hypothetical protein